MTLEPHPSRSLGALDLELDVNPALKLVHLSPDPRHLMSEVDLIAQVLPRFGGCAQGVHRGRDDGAGGFLIVEDGESGRDEDREEDGDGAHPSHATLRNV